MSMEFIRPDVLERERAEWQAKYDELEKKYLFLIEMCGVDWKEDVERLRHERDELQTRCASLERVNSDLYDWRDSLIKERDKFQSQMNDYMARYYQAKYELDELQAKYDEELRRHVVTCHQRNEWRELYQRLQKHCVRVD